MDKNIPAFPSQPASGNWGVVQQGMTLRDYFAGQALLAAGMLAIEENEDVLKETMPKVMKRCYQIADAMLKEGESHGE
jgi:hypothetical protein